MNGLGPIDLKRRKGDEPFHVEGQTGVSRVSGGEANNPRIRGNAHDPEGAGEMDERFGCSATDSIHQQAV